MAGTLPARVTSTKINDLYGHIDRDGRYRVNLLFDRDRWQPGEESLWVRQARPYAGETFGLHLPLLAGTEVAIAFEQGIPIGPILPARCTTPRTRPRDALQLSVTCCARRRTTRFASMIHGVKSTLRSAPNMAARASSTSATGGSSEHATR